MNRKAKIAYMHIVVGFVLFLVGLVTILNYSLSGGHNDQFEKKLALSIEAGDQKRVNLSDLLVPRPKSRADEDDDVDVYIHWYCQMRKQTHDSPRSSHSLLNNLFSFLICSTDTIYLIMIVCLALFGSLVLLYGCVRFYENDVMLLQQNVDESNTSGDEMPEKEATTVRDMIICCLNLNPTKTKPSESNNESSPATVYEDIQITTDPDERQKRVAAAERMCPFIYDELPAFILEKKSDLVFDCAPYRDVVKARSEPVLLTPPPPPNLPRTKPPPLNKTVLDNYVYSELNSSCPNTNVWTASEWSPNNRFRKREQPKMFSLVIERDNKRRLVDLKARAAKRNSRAASIQWSTNNECFV